MIDYVYLIYEDLDYENHCPIGIHESLKEARKMIKRKKINKSFLSIYEIPMNSMFDFNDKESIKRFDVK